MMRDMSAIAWQTTIRTMPMICAEATILYLYGRAVARVPAGTIIEEQLNPPAWRVISLDGERCTLKAKRRKDQPK